MSNKEGFTLFEALLSFMILGSVSTGILLNQIENNNQNDRLQFINEALSIVKAVDHRIAIDGYDPDLWDHQSWTNEESIVDDLIKKELTSQYHDKCEGGSWKPESNSEYQTKLLECNLWSTRKNKGESLSAELRLDSVGFIQGFDLFISFDDENNFKKYYKDLKYSLNNLTTNKSQELSGIYLNSLVSKTTKTDITSFECVNNPLDCEIKLSLERSGGNEYLRADGGNSMIGEHLSFIESKGEAPLKCLRWSNTERDGSGNWSQEVDEDCGIGIYKKTGQPTMVDTVADTGTFKNILLDKDCHFYKWNGTTVVDTGTTKPCGISNDGTEIYQVVPNTSVKDIYSENLYTDTVQTNALVSNVISAKTLEAIDKLKTDVIESYTENGSIDVNSNMTLNEIVQFENQAYFNGETYFNQNVFMAQDATVYGNIYAAGNTSDGNGVVHAQQFSIGDIKTEGSVCTVNGTLAKTSDGTLLNCVNGKWLSAIATSSPVGTVVLWASTTIPTDWVEMKGQSTASYPTLRALIGNTIPDMRGRFARGWDHGRGLDSGRGLRTGQSDAIRNITGHIDTITRDPSSSGAFSYTTSNARDWRSGNTHAYRRKYYFDASRVVPTADENRPTNVALMYIIKVK